MREILEFVLIISGFMFWIGILFFLAILVFARKGRVTDDEEIYESAMRAREKRNANLKNVNHE